jgi:fatty acid-binding protein DegV
MGVRVITDSASCLPQDLRARFRILEVALYVREGDRIVRETELDLPAFYRWIADLPGLPATSQPAPEDFAAAFEEAVSDGSEALAVVLSGGIAVQAIDCGLVSRGTITINPGTFSN